MKSVTTGALLSLLAVVLLAAPAGAQNVVRPMVAPSQINQIQIDYKAQWEKERAKNAELRAENARLSAQLQEWTRKGGSLVHAYCATETMSANSTGARNDCAASGYTCEPVSGVCRTSASNSSECAAGRTWCVYGNRCVTSAGECRP